MRFPLLPDVLLKLAGKSPHTNVVSGQSTEIVDSEPRDRLSWNGQDIPLEEVADQERVSPVYKSVATSANKHEQLQETSVRRGNALALPTLSSAAKRADSPQPSGLQTTDTLPVRGHHRRTSSATSDISLASLVSTTGAYTGFTQAGQYDLTRDVILRGEFISEQQSKAGLSAICAIFPEPVEHLRQRLGVMQAVIVCIRFATYIGVTILIVALAYKVAKVPLKCI